jgi:hypothetical protein
MAADKTDRIGGCGREYNRKKLEFGVKKSF